MTVARGTLINSNGHPQRLGATFGVRILLVGAMVACGAAYASAQQERRTDDQQPKHKVCGQVISVSCSNSELLGLHLMVDRILVSVTLESEGGRTALSSASALLFRDVCAVGQLTRKGTTDAPPVFTIATIASIAPTQEGPPTGWLRPGVALACDPGVKLPTLTKEVRPNYAREALSAGLEGTVWVAAVVETDGTIGDARIIRSLDPTRGLDAEALKAAKRWRFAAGTKDGEPTPILITIELTFSLGERRP